MAEVKKSKRFFMGMSKLPSGTAQQRKTSYNRYHGIKSYPAASYVQAKRVLTRALTPHRVPEPFKGPILLEVEYRYETKEKKKFYKLKTTRPDGDNLIKVLKDRMTELGFFNDDSEVAIESMSRFYVPRGEGGISVYIAEVSEDVYK